jgi:hypothetical protein
VQLELMADTHTTEIKVNPVYQKTPTSSEEEITAVTAAQRRWGFHVGSATKALVVMLGLLAAGTIAALGQDLFYSRVKGKHVDDVSISQDWVIRIGTTLGFIFQTVLVAAIGEAYRHRFWFGIRRKPLSIKALDTIGGLTLNPLNFFNKEIWKKTKLLLIIASFNYLIPVAMVFSPGALTGNLISCAF